MKERETEKHSSYPLFETNVRPQYFCMYNCQLKYSLEYSGLTCEEIKYTQYKYDKNYNNRRIILGNLDL